MKVTIKKREGKKMIPKSIEACERKYLNVFSTEYEDDNRVRFRNRNIPDMHSHNLTFIKKPEKELKLRGLFEEEIAISKGEHADFVNVTVNGKVNPSILSYIKYDSALIDYGFYEFDIADLSLIQSKTNCDIVKITDVSQFDDMLKVDLDADGLAIGHDFCVRRVYGKSPKYLDDMGLEGYLCYFEGTLIGRCDLFVSDGVAKIEDFCVMEAFQRKGFGTALIKHVIERAIDLACNQIYLSTLETETAKQMYLKLGFKPVGVLTEVLFRF